MLTFALFGSVRAKEGTVNTADYAAYLLPFVCAIVLVSICTNFCSHTEESL